MSTLKGTAIDPLGYVPDSALRYVVILAHVVNDVQGSLLWVRHRARTTWELPGGKIEPGETPLQAAARELQEETGARSFRLQPAFQYRSATAYGQVYTAEIARLGGTPEAGMAEVRAFQGTPEALTYPDILRALLAHAQGAAP